MQLTQKIINELFGIYREVTGSCESRLPYLEDVARCLRESGCFEYRAGSRWSGESKFIIRPSGVCFYPNYAPRGKRESRQIEQARALFEEKVNEYLDSLKRLS